MRFCVWCFLCSGLCVCTCFLRVSVQNGDAHKRHVVVWVCASGLSAPLAQISDRHFSWRRSLKSLPRQLGVRVSVCLFMYAFVRVSAHLNPELQSPTTPSQHPLFNFLLLFFHSSVKTSRVRVDRGWLAKIADYSVCMSRSNICAFISIFFLYMWNSLKERRPLSLQ